jgi:hypothetical protein
MKEVSHTIDNDDGEDGNKSRASKSSVSASVLHGHYGNKEMIIDITKIQSWRPSLFADLLVMKFHFRLVLGSNCWYMKRQEVSYASTTRENWK